MTSPLVSIVIPSYNAARWLGDAIQSVLEQTYQDWELIVVDDGSTDQTAAVTHGFLDKRVRYLYQANKGLSGARNSGVRASTGRYLAFLDADDLLFPDKLSVQVRALEADPSAAVVLSGWVYVDEDLMAIREVQPWLDCPEIGLTEWLVGCPFVVHGTLVRSEAVLAVGGFDEGLEACEDADLFLRLAAEGYQMRWLPEIVCSYRIHHANMTHNPSRAQANVRVLDKFFRSKAACGIGEQTRRRAYANAWLRVSRTEYAAGQYRQAQESMTKAIQLWPSLAEGAVPVLIRTIHDWALDPRVPDALAFASMVFVHLPPELTSLVRHRPKTMASLHADRAFWHKERCNSQQALSHLGAAILADPSWLRNRGVWAIAAKAAFALAKD